MQDGAFIDDQSDPGEWAKALRYPNAIRVLPDSFPASAALDAGLLGAAVAPSTDCRRPDFSPFHTPEVTEQ